MSEVTGLNEIAPVFIEMAHRMVWCTAATVDVSGAPRTRVLHPIWEWENGTLTGWIAGGRVRAVRLSARTTRVRASEVERLIAEGSK